MSLFRKRLLSLWEEKHITETDDILLFLINGISNKNNNAISLLETLIEEVKFTLEKNKYFKPENFNKTHSFTDLSSELQDFFNIIKTLNSNPEILKNNQLLIKIIDNCFKIKVIEDLKEHQINNFLFFVIFFLYKNKLIRNIPQIELSSQSDSFSTGASYSLLNNRILLEYRKFLNLISPEIIKNHIIHELAHYLYSLQESYINQKEKEKINLKNFVQERIQELSKPYGFIINILEDIRVDNKISNNLMIAKKTYKALKPFIENKYLLDFETFLKPLLQSITTINDNETSLQDVFENLSSKEKNLLVIQYFIFLMKPVGEYDLYGLSYDKIEKLLNNTFLKKTIKDLNLHSLKTDFLTLIAEAKKSNSITDIEKKARLFWEKYIEPLIEKEDLTENTEKEDLTQSQSTNQPANQPTNQSGEQSENQPEIQFDSQSSNQLENQPEDQPENQHKSQFQKSLPFSEKNFFKENISDLKRIFKDTESATQSITELPSERQNSKTTEQSENSTSSPEYSEFLSEINRLLKEQEKEIYKELEKNIFDFKKFSPDLPEEYSEKYYLNDDFITESYDFNAGIKKSISSAVISITKNYSLFFDSYENINQTFLNKCLEKYRKGKTFAINLIQKLSFWYNTKTRHCGEKINLWEYEKWKMGIKKTPDFFVKKEFLKNIYEKNIDLVVDLSGSMQACRENTVEMLSYLLGVKDGLEEKGKNVVRFNFYGVKGYHESILLDFQSLKNFRRHTGIHLLNLLKFDGRFEGLIAYLSLLGYKDPLDPQRTETNQKWKNLDLILLITDAHFVNASDWKVLEALKKEKNRNFGTVGIYIPDKQEKYTASSFETIRENHSQAFDTWMIGNIDIVQTFIEKIIQSVFSDQIKRHYTYYINTAKQITSRYLGTKRIEALW